MFERKVCTKCGVVKEHTEFHKAAKIKSGLASRCKMCDYEYQKHNPRRAEVQKRSADKYRAERNQKAREKNRQARIEKYTSRLEGQNAYVRYRAQRQIAKVAATPPWLTRDDRGKTSGIYAAAAMLQELTCAQYDVDHIVPLQSDVVCGLNVWWNLQAIPQSLNAQKRNIFDPSIYLDQGKVAFPDGYWTERRAEHAANFTENDDD